uniref:Helicase RNase D C terminal HRDC domain n=1 Tax=Echinococcus granulosus TaxID=6210 RepID=A0A068WTQ2_ECHGR|nr:Helicase RNase D C terminal HRDC domain [Echinococcus granulosus]
MHGNGCGEGLVSTLVPGVAQAVKFSHEFPTNSTPAYIYYNDFAEYQAVMNGNSSKILTTIQDVIDELDGKANIMDAPQPKSLEEKFNTIVCINDEIIDRVTAVMDKEEFPDRANNGNAQNFLVRVDGQQTSLSSKENKCSPFDSDWNKRRDVGGRSTAKLFASKHIVRPQNFFTVRPDNSHAPFLPILKSKPNALVNLQDCTFEADPETGDYTHPYLSELEDYGKRLGDYKYVTPASNPRPLPLNETPLDIIDTADALNNMLQELNTASEIAVDLEVSSAPLPKTLIEYARSDTHYLLYVAELLRGLLAGQDLLTEVLQRSQELCLRIYKKPKFNTLEYLSKSHTVVRMSLDKRQLYALKHLCIVRDSIARKEDESHAFVLPNHMMHQIAEKLPKETTGMYACCNPVPPLLRKYVSDFHQVVLDARNGKHIEQEIDADVVILESVTPASSSPNVVPSHTTASRSAPHDTLRLATQQTPNANSCQDSLRRNCPTRPSLFGRRFPQSPRPLFEAFIDPSRFVPQKILDAVKSIQVSDRVPVEEDLSFTSTALTPNASVSETKEDRLFKPPPVEHSSVSGGKAPSPIKLTAAEAIEVEDVGAKFCLGSVSFGRSAQCRALANLKNRRQQRNSSPQQSEEFDQNRLPDSQEDDDVSSETDVVVLRDQKLKRLPKGTKPQVRQGHSSGITTNLTKDSPTQPDQSPQSPPPPLALLEIPMTLEIQAAIHQTPSSSGRRKRRSRGGRGGGATGASSSTLQGSISFSRSGCASFTPSQPQKKRNN